MSRRIRLGDVVVDLDRRCLDTGDGERPLRQKSFAVLLYLLERPGRLVTKDELIAEIWKETAVTDDVLVQCVGELRRALGDDRHQPAYIRTIPRAGYLLVAPVTDALRTTGADSVLDDQPVAATSDAPATPVESRREEIEPPLRPQEVAGPRLRDARRWRRPLMSLAGLAALVAALLSMRTPGAPASDVFLPDPTPPSVIVLFFENQTGSPDLDWLREGLPDMIIAGLSQPGDIRVLTRQQLGRFLTRGGGRFGGELGLDAALEVARLSGASRVVLGSFGRVGRSLRIDAQAYDSRGSSLATIGTVAESEDEILARVDTLTLELRRHLGLGPPPETSEVWRVVTANVDAYRYYSLGLEKAQALHNTEALQLFEKAVALDPDFALAHARIGFTYAMTWGHALPARPYLRRAFALSDRLTERNRLAIAAWSATANYEFAEAIALYRRIVQAYPDDPEGYVRLGRLLAGEDRLDESLDVLRRATAVAPNEPGVQHALSNVYSAAGRHASAIDAGRRYVVLADDEPNAHDTLGLALQWSGDYEGAIASYDKALALDPEFEPAIIHLGNAYFQIGRPEPALSRFERYVAVAPSDAERARGYHSIGVVHLSQGALPQAERAAREIGRLSPEYAWLDWEIALAKHDIDAALETGRALLDPRRDQGLNRGSRPLRRSTAVVEARLLELQGRTSEAIGRFQTALRYQPVVWHIDPFESSLADAYLRLGRFEDAAAEYQRVLRINPRYPLAVNRLAQARRSIGPMAEGGGGQLATPPAEKNATPADPARPETGDLQAGR